VRASVRSSVCANRAALSSGGRKRLRRGFSSRMVRLDRTDLSSEEEEEERIWQGFLS